MLHLWMPETSGAWHWSVGEHWNQAVSLEQLIQDIQGYHGEEAVVFFPSRNLQILQQQLPKVQYKQLGADGVKYLLEEFVIFPMDAMKVLNHFQSPDQLTVLGVSKGAVETMQHALNLIPVKIVSLLPDFLILPVPAQDETVIVNINGRLLVRENEFLGNSIDDLSLFLDYQPKSKKYRISGFKDEQLSTVEAAATQELLESFQYEFTVLKKSKNHPFNFLPKATREGGVSGYWKACAAVLLSVLAIQFSYDAVRWFKLKKVADQTALQATDQFKYWFGQNYPVTEQNIKSQFKAQLGKSKAANTQALQLLSRIGPVLMQNQIVAQRVNYDASMLSMELKAGSSTVLQNLTQQLNQQGFKVELGNIQPDGAGVIGLVKIQ
ncbi:type II secretion system protein GspL [Acinetobacter chinensis]|uniref:type II secretion system protein GspL n=1 Tax=Acinetobacter chinensis TaxID=2004650 RepID=UPI0029351BD3|nr:type II secretion system protein GspL [Acinetobacter chinensis]WOE42901.1 type II secretion system protein GspL [Acinetobacter chinensis]